MENNELDYYEYQPVQSPQITGKQPARLHAAKFRTKEDGAVQLIVEFELDGEFSGEILSRFVPWRDAEGRPNRKVRWMIDQIMFALGFPRGEVVRLSRDNPLEEKIGTPVILDVKMGEYQGDRRPEIKSIKPGE